jgi:hypothetical protein
MTMTVKSSTQPAGTPAIFPASLTDGGSQRAGQGMPRCGPLTAPRR